MERGMGALLGWVGFADILPGRAKDRTPLPWTPALDLSTRLPTSHLFSMACKKPRMFNVYEHV
jgi:hypothetical protein